MIQVNCPASRPTPYRDAALGHLPAVPNAAPLTASADLLFKNDAEGQGPRDPLSCQRQRRSTPDPYRSALKDHYDFVQAVYHTVRTPGPLMGLLPGQPFSVDMRPPNLVWVEDPDTLSSLGYRRPGFVSFEMSAVPLNRPVYIESEGTSFEDYLAEFQTYMQREAAE